MKKQWDELKEGDWVVYRKELETVPFSNSVKRRFNDRIIYRVEDVSTLPSRAIQVLVADESNRRLWVIPERGFEPFELEITPALTPTPVFNVGDKIVYNGTTTTSRPFRDCTVGNEYEVVAVTAEYIVFYDDEDDKVSWAYTREANKNYFSLIGQSSTRSQNVPFIPDYDPYEGMTKRAFMDAVDYALDENDLPLFNELTKEMEKRGYLVALGTGY